jgi:hypothetical protein
MGKAINQLATLNKHNRIIPVAECNHYFKYPLIFQYHIDSCMGNLRQDISVLYFDRQNLKAGILNHTSSDTTG